ncbi:dihydrolipoamide acetyltransferase family protein [Aeromicrobium sp.]|uniref:dihydrolipoamide acetyltransferase family protein n=1 Tax=Aeromicrobium sp. TaxID=1871063 RepID=UPI003D6A9F77
MSEFKLPDVGEGLTEAEIITWRVAIGDTVKVNDILVDIETAKSIVELPSPFAGVVTALLVEEGKTVPVGTPIIAIGDGKAGQAQDPASKAFSSTATAGAIVEGEHADEAAPAADEPVDEPAEERQPVLVGYGPRAGEVSRRRKVSGAASEPAESDDEVAPLSGEAEVATEPVVEHVGSTARPTVHALAKPPVRKLAKDLGIDLADVPTDGAIVTRADVEAYAKTGSAGPSVPATREPTRPISPTLSAPVEGDVRIPIKGVRKWTADAMVASAFTAPHVTEWVTLDVSRTVELVDRLRRDRAFSDVKVSPTLIVAKAVCLAMRRTPELNAQWDDENQEIVLKRAVNLGIAAATQRGLVVPNIRDADRMTMLELATALADLTATARAGKAQPSDLSGGTFTITNVGVFGVDAGTPIINPGESGILAVGAIERRPWVDDNDEIVARWVTTLALSFDHRIVDGEQGSRFLADVAAILRDPATALTY